MNVERRFTEIRSPEPNSRILEGIAIHYNEIGQGDYGPERFLPGSMEYGDVRLDKQHNRESILARTPDTLQLTDTEEALSLRATLPHTRDCDDVLTLIRTKVLRGLSVEFIPIEQRAVQGIREISRARLLAVAVVDDPAYENSTVEARFIRGARMNFKVRYNRRLKCECCKKSDTVIFDEAAFDDVLKDDKKELLAVHGNYTGAVASRKRGTLKLQNTEDGLEISSDLADTTAGRDILEQGKDVPLLGRPIVDFDKSETVEEAGALRVRKAHLRGFIIGPSDNDEGWDPIRFTDGTEERKRILTCDARGLPFWL